jgi:FkbM family methyltransferase
VVTSCDHEVLVQETYEALLREGDIAVDVGAHKGRHCLAMAEQVFPGGKVLAFEPLAVCRQHILTETTQYRPELDSVLMLYPYALSDHSGEAEFVVAKDALAYSGLKERPYDWSTKLKRIIVPVRTLDEFCCDLPSLRYMKIDAEGGEYHILKGASHCLRQFRPVVVFEFGAISTDAYQVTPTDMAHYWVEQEYKVYGIVGNYLAVEDFIRSAHTQAIHDYVAVPAENTSLERTVVEVLTRPPAWHRVTTHVDMAEHTANTGGALPLLARFRGLRRGLARLASWPVIYATQVITRPQRLCNHALVRSVRSLIKILRQKEREMAGYAARATEQEAKANGLARRLEEVEKATQELLASLSRALHERDGHIADLEKAVAEIRSGCEREKGIVRAA